MRDPRVEDLARLLVDRSLDVRPDWQVLVKASALARPLVDAIVRRIAQRGAYALVRVSITGHDDIHWTTHAPEELVATLSPLELHEAETCDARMAIWAPENTREPAAVADARRRLRAQATEPLFRRAMSGQIPWVVVDYPCPSLAQEAGMTLRQFAEFLYGACLIDWDGLGVQMQRIKERFDRAETVRVVGDGTDLTLGLGGREGIVEDGHINMPGGEVYYGPVETKTEGTITFSEFPAVYYGREVVGARLVFSGGRVVDAGAESGEDFLLATLDTDEGARVVGELGIGTNPGITRFMKNVAFDEKIAGTIHLALGESYATTGGVNRSGIHWDMVKDLRQGGRIELDGEVVQENGEWLIG